MLTWYRIKLNKPSLTALAPRLRDRQALLVSRHSCLPKVHAYKIRATTFYEDIVALQGLRPPRRDAACVELEAGSVHGAGWQQARIKPYFWMVEFNA